MKCVSVIIPCRNEGKFIEKLLVALIAQDYPREKTEVFFVDGLSTDGTREIIERYSRQYEHIKLRSNPKIVVPAAMNIGIRQARGEVIVRMDAHTVYPKDYLSKCVDYLDKTGAENVGGSIKSVSDSFWGKAIAAGMSSIFGVGNARFRLGNFEGYVDTVPFGAYRREVFDRIGLFDEELARNQDDELNYRLIKRGGKIFMAPEIISYYYPRDSLKKLWRQYFEYGYWKVRVIQKHKLPASWRHLVPVTFVLSILGSGLLSVIDKRYLYLISSILVSYFLTSVFFSMKIAREEGKKYFLVLPAVFATLHISYGVGFLKGIVDFLILWPLRKRKKSSGRTKECQP